ncbi:zinc finger MYM-type protein 5-like [Hydra vulgaris]|uniref:Zinc finger MYM-type protein 5-like n=1 Tax=Hydra vulgaris TaxID=6087 RepID=A0ABM4B1V1_HYDVU
MDGKKHAQKSKPVSCFFMPAQSPSKKQAIFTVDQNLNVTFSCGIATNASVDQIVIEDIVDEASRSDEINSAKTTISTCDGDVQQTSLAICIQIPDDLSTVFMNISDPAIWPLIRNSKVIDHIISNCQVQTHIDIYPKNDTGRHFSNCYFTKKLANNETIQRRWLIYPVSKYRVYCFCCRLFDSKSTSSLVSEGYNNWKHLSEMLKVHENSTSHKKSYLLWIDTELRLKTGKAIDCQEQRLIRKETA